MDTEHEVKLREALRLLASAQEKVRDVRAGRVGYERRLADDLLTQAAIAMTSAASTITQALHPGSSPGL